MAQQRPAFAQRGQRLIQPGQQAGHQQIAPVGALVVRGEIGDPLAQGGQAIQRCAIGHPPRRLLQRAIQPLLAIGAQRLPPIRQSRQQRDQHQHPHQQSPNHPGGFAKVRGVEGQMGGE